MECIILFQKSIFLSWAFDRYCRGDGCSFTSCPGIDVRGQHGAWLATQMWTWTETGAGLGLLVPGAQT